MSVEPPPDLNPGHKVTELATAAQAGAQIVGMRRDRQQRSEQERQRDERAQEQDARRADEALERAEQQRRRDWDRLYADCERTTRRANETDYDHAAALREAAVRRQRFDDVVLAMEDAAGAGPAEQARLTRDLQTAEDHLTRAEDRVSKTDTAAANAEADRLQAFQALQYFNEHGRVPTVLELAETWARDNDPELLNRLTEQRSAATTAAELQALDDELLDIYSTAQRDLAGVTVNGPAPAGATTGRGTSAEDAKATAWAAAAGAEAVDEDLADAEDRAARYERTTPDHAATETVDEHDQAAPDAAHHEEQRDVRLADAAADRAATMAARATNGAPTTSPSAARPSPGTGAQPAPRRDQTRGR